MLYNTAAINERFSNSSDELRAMQAGFLHWRLTTSHTQMSIGVIHKLRNALGGGVGHVLHFVAEEGGQCQCYVRHFIFLDFDGI